MEYKEISLTKGKVAIVDAADYEWLNQWKWYAVNGRYAARTERVEDGRRMILMHRQICGIDGVDPSIEVDHENGDKLDNRRSNLRICNRSQNCSNRVKRKGCTSQFKGVSWHKPLKTWIAQIKKHRMPCHLGLFASEIEAAKAYDKAAMKLFGEFARTNF